MKVLLIYPYFLDRRLNAEDIQAPPMGIYYVAAVLMQHGHEVEVLNWHDRGIPPEGIESVLREKKPRLIGLSVLHANRWGAIEIARIAKRVDPGVTIVFGGVVVGLRHERWYGRDRIYSRDSLAWQDSDAADGARLL